MSPNWMGSWEMGWVGESRPQGKALKGIFIFPTRSWFSGPSLVSLFSGSMKWASFLHCIFLPWAFFGLGASAYVLWVKTNSFKLCVLDILVTVMKIWLTQFVKKGPDLFMTSSSLRLEAVRTDKCLCHLLRFQFMLMGFWWSGLPQFMTTILFTSTCPISAPDLGTQPFTCCLSNSDPVTK